MFSDRNILTSFFLLSLLIFSHGLSIHGIEYRDDEIFYYQSTQEMIQNHDVLSPTYFGANRFEKPILFYWFILLFYKIFGVNWFAARFVSVIFAGLTVCLTWKIARHLFDRRIATLSALILMTTPLFFRHAKNAVPGMALTFFVVAAMSCLLQILRAEELPVEEKQRLQNKYSILFFVACGLGFMIKGYTAIVVPWGTLLVYAFWSKTPGILKTIRFGRGILIFLLIVSPWFIYMIWRHGHVYLDHVLIVETKERLIGNEAGNFLIVWIKKFVSHIGFYLKNMFSYFAPWSLFLFLGLPLLFKKTSLDTNLKFLLSWFGLVFFFFASLYFVINHYLMALIVPFAILVSYVFLTQGKSDTVLKIQKISVVVTFTLGFLGFSLFLVLFMGISKIWLILLFIFYALLLGILLKSKTPLTAPVLLSLLILCVFCQSNLLGKAKLTSQATLQNFAKVINSDPIHHVIGVGSHDIHRKEFQTYFDQKVDKLGMSDADKTRVRLKLFLTTHKKRVYCLILEKDLKDYLKKFPRENLVTVKEDSIVRRRMSIDKNFFIALAKLDQATIHQYLMERIILLRKDPHG